VARPVGGQALLREAVDRLGLTARGLDRLLRVARTIADLAGREEVRTADVSEALQFRSEPSRDLDSAPLQGFGSRA